MSQDRATIAFLLISYNQSRYILEALSGIHQQRSKPDEVIIADDGSSDGTPEKIYNFCDSRGLIGRWKLLLAKNNLGINANLQRALDCVRSEYVVIIAGDDVCLPNRCEVARRLVESLPNYNIITTSGRIIDQDGAEIGKYRHSRKVYSNITSAIRSGNPRVLPVGHIIKMKLLKNYGPLPLNVPNEDDQISFWGLLSGGVITDETETFLYRVHDFSASAWLRQSDEKTYYEKAFFNMRVRARHLSNWASAVSRSNRNDQRYLIRMIEKKCKLLEILATIDRTQQARLHILFKFYDVLSFHHTLIVIFGQRGFDIYNSLRTAYNTLFGRGT